MTEQPFINHTPGNRLGTSSAAFMVRYIFDKIFRNVAIVGGTHGNERIGVLLAEHWQQQPEPVTRTTFQTKVGSLPAVDCFYFPSVGNNPRIPQVLVANPEAVRLNRRFVDVDLNRCFQLTETDVGLNEKNTSTAICP